MVIEKNNLISIISGCSHNGITTLVETAKSIFGLNINMVLGGFHLEESNTEKVDEVIKYFDKIGFNSIGVSHCTDIDKFCILKNKFGDKVFYNYTGKEINI